MVVSPMVQYIQQRVTKRQDQRKWGYRSVYRSNKSHTVQTNTVIGRALFLDKLKNSTLVFVYICNIYKSNEVLFNFKFFVPMSSK